MKLEPTTSTAEQIVPQADSKTKKGPFSVPAGVVVDQFGNTFGMSGGEVSELPKEDRVRLFGFV